MRATDVARLRLAETAVTSESAYPIVPVAVAIGAAVPVPVATDKAGLAANPADDDDHEVDAAAVTAAEAASAGGGGAYGRI